MQIDIVLCMFWTKWFHQDNQNLYRHHYHHQDRHLRYPDKELLLRLYKSTFLPDSICKQIWASSLFVVIIIIVIMIVVIFVIVIIPNTTFGCSGTFLEDSSKRKFWARIFESIILSNDDDIIKKMRLTISMMITMPIKNICIFGRFQLQAILTII